MSAGLVAKARAAAVASCDGAVDKAGRPYIDHLARVVKRLKTADEKAVGWLHDIVEDGWATEAWLRICFPERIADAVMALTHVPHERRDEYYCNMAGNPLAVAVKLADIADNSDPERLVLLDGATAERLRAKYAKAREFLGADHTGKEIQ